MGQSSLSVMASTNGGSETESCVYTNGTAAVLLSGHIHSRVRSTTAHGKPMVARHCLQKRVITFTGKILRVLGLPAVRLGRKQVGVGLGLGLIKYGVTCSFMVTLTTSYGNPLGYILLSFLRPICPV
jgi:hypothetical protein